MDQVSRALWCSSNLNGSFERIKTVNMNGRTRSASLGRDRKSDLKARYWAFLFENLQHAVDELYQTCESDENISECKEVILILENYTREFHNLAEWFRVKWEYENTPPPQRPNSLAWEIRKSSPGKVFRKKCQPTLNGIACRELLHELNKNPSCSLSESKLENDDSANALMDVSKKQSYSVVRASLKEMLSARIETSDCIRVNNFSQTDSESLSFNATKKSPPANTGRKLAVTNVASCNAKIPRCASGSNVTEAKISLSATSTLSTKRYAGCVSHRKPAPGRNIAAAVFVPGKKTASIGSVGVKSSACNDSKVVTTNSSNRTKMSRSQSDSLFETKNNRSKKTSAATGKPYTSVECVSKDDNEEQASVTNARSSSKFASVHSLDVIDETLAKETSKATDTSKNEEDDDDEQIESKNNSSINSRSSDNGIGGGVGCDELSCKKTSITTTTKNARIIPCKSICEINGENKTKTEKTVSETTKYAPVVISKLSTRLSSENARNGNADAIERRVGNISASKLSSVAQSRYINGHRANNNKITNAGKSGGVFVRVLGKNVSEKKNVATPKTEDFKTANNSTDRSEKRATAARTTTKCGNYSTIVKSNSFQDGGGIKRVGHSKFAEKSMIRSKTWIDMKYGGGNVKNSRSVAATRGGDRVGNTSSVSHASGGERESPPKNRRSSKDTDGWETVISRSRRSIPNFVNSAKNKTFDVNNRFYEPSPSTSLPTLVMTAAAAAAEINGNVKDKQGGGGGSSSISSDGDPKTKCTESKCKSRNRNNSYSSGSIGNGNRDTTIAEKKDGVTVSTALAAVAPASQSPSAVAVAVAVVAATTRQSGGEIAAENYRDYKLNKERPIISSTYMFTTIQPKKKKPCEKDGGRKSRSGAKENKSGNVVAQLTKRKCGKEADERCKEDLLDEESLRKSKELYEKEISLQKEINDLQNDADLESDVDSDGTEIDQEIVDLCNGNKEANAFERRAALEAKYNHILTNMTWAEQIETLDKLEELLVRDPSGKCLKFAENFTSLKQFEDLVTRAPGRALEIHQKLSSPSRKRTSPDSTILQHKARQAKAKQNREQLLQDKSAKIRELLNKVAEVKAMQAQLTNERRKVLEQKLKKAEENRNLHLKNIQEKAHDEAKKQKEIAFINELEAQNKRHDFYALCQEQEDRLQSILEERQRRQEEKAAKEAAVEERRKAIEAERQEKIEELQEKMRKREERIDRELQEKERERIKMAREKARDREDRLLALQAAQIANAEELQKKIQQKQESSARRHEENIELIRQKAIEIGTPRLTPYQINKLCSVCNVVIDSEVFLLSHLKGKSHQEAVKKYREQFEAGVKFSECSIITDAPADLLHEKKTREQERQKMLRKRCKKIRHRLSSRSEEYLKNVSAEKEKIRKIDSSHKGRILKSIKEIDKLISTQGNGLWPNNAVTMLERNLFEVVRVLEKGNEDDQFMFRQFEGFSVLSKIYNLALDLPKNMSPYLPLKCFVVTSNLLAAACHENTENSLHVLLSNNIVQILDLLLNRLNLIMPNSDDRNGMVVYKADSVADVLMNVCSNLLSNITSYTLNDDNSSREVCAHLQDVVSYVVCTGIVDKLAVYCSSVHDNKSADSYFLLHCMELLTRLVETRRNKITDKEDCTQLMATLKATELVGAVSMLYAMLLHQDSMSNDNLCATMICLPPQVVNVIIATLRLFSKVGELNLKFFQNILGAEGISLQVRHIISYLLRYCSQNQGYKELLHQVIEFIGFFAINHADNQMILQSGSTPTVLQQLSSLPFAYFSNPCLVKILFPTLLACCVGNAQNRAILDQEVSFQLLEDFRNAPDSKDVPLIKLLQAN